MVAKALHEIRVCNSLFHVVWFVPSIYRLWKKFEMEDFNIDSDAHKNYDLNLIGHGYCPLSVRLVERSLSSRGWNQIGNSKDLIGRIGQIDAFKSVSGIF